MGYCISNRNDALWRHFLCHTRGLWETTLSVHIKASALQTSYKIGRHPAAKSFQGPILAPRSKFHTVTLETSSNGEETEEGEQVGSLSRWDVPMRCSAEARLIQGSGAGKAHFWHAICTLHTVWLLSRSLSLYLFISLPLSFYNNKALYSLAVNNNMLIFILEFLIGGQTPNHVHGVKMNQETKTKAQLLMWLRLCQHCPPP